MSKTKNNNNQKFLLRFVTSYSILLIFVLTMGLFLYQYGVKDAKKSVIDQNKNMLENSMNNMDFTIRQISSLTTQLANNSNVLSLVNIESIDDSDFYNYSIKVMNDLKEIIPLETLMPINDYYIYLPKTNYLLSTNMLTDARLYYKHSKSYKMELFEQWIEGLTSDENMYKLTSLKEFSNSKENYSYQYKIPLSNYSLFKKYPGVICVEFNRSDINKIFSDINFFKDGFLIITDKDNNEILRVNEKSRLNFDLDVLLQLTNKGTSTRDILETTYNNESIIITSITSENNGWNYYLVQPSSMTFQELYVYQQVYSLIIVMTLFFCFIFIYLLSKKNVKPIIQINTQLQTSIQENTNLQKTLEEQKPIIFNSYMSKILKGLIYNNDELAQIKDFLQIDTEHYKYTILYACVYLDQLEFYTEDISSVATKAQDLSTYEHVLQNYFFKYFGNDIYVCNVDVNAFALMIPCPASEAIEDSIARIKERFLALHDQLMNDHSLWIFAGLGNRNSEISFLWKAYQQATQAASVVREGHVFQSFYNLKRDRSTYYYPFEMAQQLSNFISTGNEKQVHEIFRLIKKENFEARTLSITLIKWLLSDIRNTLLKVRFSITTTTKNKDILDQFDLGIQENKTIDLMEELSIKLCSLYEQKAEGNKLIASIQQYINENYKDSALSLKKISDVFDISESYFSYLFKAEVKQNFSEYLEQLRMEQAMMLVKTTNINISDLYLEVGYNNANSFRRAFKKVHGVAPKAIRDAMNN